MGRLQKLAYIEAYGDIDRGIICLDDIRYEGMV